VDQSKREALMRILRCVDIYFGNDEEIRMLTDERNLIKAGKMIQAMGPRLVIVKKGEHGALVFGPDFYLRPAGPAHRDGHRSDRGGRQLRRRLPGLPGSVRGLQQEGHPPAAVYGSVMASFSIEGFGIDRYRTLTAADVAARYREFRILVSF